MTNFFKLNSSNFHTAADYINQHCIRFAGRSIRSAHSPWVFDCLARGFSACDNATAALNYDCTLDSGLECVASISTDGAVTLIDKAHFDEWCLCH